MEDNAVKATKTEEKEEKEPMTTKQKVIFGLKIAGNVVFYAVIIALFLFAIFNINGGNGTEDFPHLFGHGLLNVSSNSMKRDEDESKWPAEWADYEIGGFEIGDLLNDKVFDEEDKDELKVGDVITFRFLKGSSYALNTHRIVYIHKTDDGVVDYVITQGDYVAQTFKYNPANATENYVNQNSTIASQDGNDSYTYFEHVEIGDIRGVVTSVTKGAGTVLSNLQEYYLFIFVLPVALLLIVEIFFVVRNIMVLKGEKNKAELASTREQMIADVEAEKEKMRQELLAEMRAQGLVTTAEPKPEEPKTDAPAEEVQPEEVKEVTSEDAPETTEAPEDKPAEDENSASDEKKSEE